MNTKRLFFVSALVITVAFLLAVAISLQTPAGPSLKGSYCADKPAGTTLWAEVVCP